MQYIITLPLLQLSSKYSWLFSYVDFSLSIYSSHICFSFQLKQRIVKRKKKEKLYEQLQAPGLIRSLIQIA